MWVDVRWEGLGHLRCHKEMAENWVIGGTGLVRLDLRLIDQEDDKKL